MSVCEMGQSNFWGFVGALNPLESLRRFLNDSRNWRKYKHQQNEELRRLYLENKSRELAILKEVLSIMRAADATEEDLAWIRTCVQRVGEELHQEDTPFGKFPLKAEHLVRTRESRPGV